MLCCCLLSALLSVYLLGKQVCPTLLNSTIRPVSSKAIQTYTCPQICLNNCQLFVLSVSPVWYLSLVSSVSPTRHRVSCLCHLLTCCADLEAAGPSGRGAGPRQAALAPAGARGNKSNKIRKSAAVDPDDAEVEVRYLGSPQLFWLLSPTPLLLSLIAPLLSLLLLLLSLY